MKQSSEISRPLSLPLNRMVDDNPLDCIRNVQGILALLSMINLEDDAVPDGAQNGHFYLLLMVKDTLQHVERLLEQEAQS
ncbi:MAG TPA: hypothetical protein PLD30_17045 [Candidatus Competibacteraceae bacterium]|nr:hypothetical protein [Candidatus Competibacteraceae bacterium]